MIFNSTFYLLYSTPSISSCVSTYRAPAYFLSGCIQYYAIMYHYLVIWKGRYWFLFLWRPVSVRKWTLANLVKGLGVFLDSQNRYQITSSTYKYLLSVVKHIIFNVCCLVFYHCDSLSWRLTFTCAVYVLENLRKK